MINLEEWGDYKYSSDRIRAVEWHTSGGKAHRLLVAGVKHMIKHNVLVVEDRNYALELIGEKTPNSAGN